MTLPITKELFLEVPSIAIFGYNDIANDQESKDCTFQHII